MVERTSAAAPAATRCDNGVGGGSIVSQRTGRCPDDVVVWTARARRGLSPWPLRLVYYDTVVPARSSRRCGFRRWPSTTSGA